MASKKKTERQASRKFHFNRWYWAAAILIVLGCVAYANSLDAPFFYDDINTIQQNTAVRSGDYFTFDLKLYLQTRALLAATFGFNQWLGGQNVLGYHVVNVLLHVLNALLVFAIAIKLFTKIKVGFEITHQVYTYTSLTPSTVS